MSSGLSTTPSSMILKPSFIVEYKQRSSISYDNKENIAIFIRVLLLIPAAAVIN